MASRRGEEVHGDGLEEEYIDMDLSPAAAVAGREFEFHMSAPLDRSGQPPLASPADELFYKGKLLPLHLPPRVQMVEELLLDGCGTVRGRGPRLGGLSVSTAPATPCERSRGVSPANSCFVSGELNVEEFFREYAAGMALADDDAASVASGEKKPWSRKLRFVRQLNLGRQLKASKAYLKTMFAGKQAGTGGDDKNVFGGKDISGHGHQAHHPRAWRKNPFGHIRSNKCITEQGSGSGGRAGHRRSFSSVVVRYSASNKTSPAPAPPSSSLCSSTSSSSKSSASSSVRCSSDSDGGAAAGAPALRRSSSASSEAENPIQGLIAYCKKSQQLASVRKSASDAGFRFLSSSAASKVAAESDGLDELIEICKG